MSSLPQIKAELESMRASLFQPFQEAKARGDTAEMAQLTTLAGQIDDALDDLAIEALTAVAVRLNGLRAKVDALTRRARGWPFGTAEAPEDHERPFVDALPENDFEDEGPDQPPPSASPEAIKPDTVPVVSEGWSEVYSELWKAITVSPDWVRKADAIAKKIVANQSRYAAAVAGTQVPWWFIAIVHAMECSLRFDQHLHNGDPLEARTVRVPKGRPPAGSPPFTWEESARDAIAYEKLDKIDDWSIASALYHWHRYNGINNEYKRRGIPTPYLWSGSQHYRKGKYVADHVFDPEAVSQQVGAAVVLNALVDLGAVIIGDKQQVEDNPAVATGDAATIKIDISGPDFDSAVAELTYPGRFKKGGGKTKAEKAAVRRIQEWLNIHDCVTSIDEDYGDSTETQLRAFQMRSGRQPTGELDAETWALLTAPMRRALAPADHGPAPTLESAVIEVAQQHIRERPVEIGGNNMGPWVRLFMRGQQGKAQKWCAGFICLIVAQAARDLGVTTPFTRQVGVDALVADAKASGRLIKEKDVADPIARKSKVLPGSFFVVRRKSTDWTHVGIVLALRSTTFDTLEGNTGGDGGTDGTNARQGNRSYAGKDFLRLVQ
ncbi:peptidoglycan-binding protein [Mesorhizobium sp. M1340]|uniref:peptidoglycan-binding protein n=1 Tax=unclassified Mesorhizobium TaxID=325217 RepID=UPI0033365E25